MNARVCSMVLWPLAGLSMALLGVVSAARGEIIPPERRIQWQAGVPGGIPHRTQIFCNVKTGIPGSARVAKGDGVADDTDALADAITLCPTGQVVFIPAGIYKITRTISAPQKRHITVRGDGPTRTILRASLPGGAQSVFQWGNSAWKPPGTAVLAGATKGSTSITVASAAGLAPGGLMLIDQLNDGSLVNSRGTGGVWTSGDRPRDGTRNLSQMLRITAVSGTGVTFSPTLNWTYTAARSPQVAAMAASVVRVGMEDLKIENANGVGQYHIFFETADSCWVRNIDSSLASHWHLLLYQSLNCEIRDSYFHEAATYTVNAGYGVEARMTTATLIENNIFYHLYAPLLVNSGSSGCIMAYNYIVHTYNSDPTYMIVGLSANHGAHPMMNLWEGNVGNELQADNFWGSSSHQTLFRNHLTGTDVGVTVNRKAVALDAQSFDFNIVGNVLGSPGLSWTYTTETSGFSITQNIIYRLGYPNIGNNHYDATNPLDGRVKATLLRHGNYDYATQSTLWDAAIADRVLPPSLYLSAKPAWWGAGRWPAIGPDLSPMVVSIPARLRYEGAEPTPVAPYPQPPGDFRIVP